MLALLLCVTTALVQGALAQTQPAADKPSAIRDAEAGYEIGPDDILKVTVFGHEDLTQVVVVQADGTFNFPLIGRVKASAMGPKELGEKIQKLLADGYVLDPAVSVVVQEYRSQVVFVVGEVAHPGTYPLSGSRTVIEVLGKAGPMTSSAGSEIIIVRPRPGADGPPVRAPLSGPADPVRALEDEGLAEVRKVDLRRIESGDLAENLALRPNDTVLVPQAPRVFVSGEVRNPGGYPISPDMTVRQAISLAGGPTQRASGSARVIRRIGGATREIKVGLEDLVQPGDTIVVKQRLF